MKQKNPNNLQVKPQTIKCIIGEGDKKKKSCPRSKARQSCETKIF